MNWLIKWGVRKWLVGVVNTALVDYAEKVETARHYLSLAVSKIEAVTAFLKALDCKLADGKITNDEVDAAIADAQSLASKLTA